MFKDGIQMRNVLFGVKLIDHKWEKAIEKGIFRNKYQSKQVFASASFVTAGQGSRGGCGQSERGISEWSEEGGTV